MAAVQAWIIADSSAWIALLLGQRSPVGQRLQAVLRAGEPVRMLTSSCRKACRAHATRVISSACGSRCKRFRRSCRVTRARLRNWRPWLYARCRWEGITLRSPNDALIAACAIESGEPLLHADVDFERMAQFEPRLRLA